MINIKHVRIVNSPESPMSRSGFAPSNDRCVMSTAFESFDLLDSDWSTNPSRSIRFIKHVGLTIPLNLHRSSLQ